MGSLLRRLWLTPLAGHNYDVLLSEDAALVCNEDRLVLLNLNEGDPFTLFKHDAALYKVRRSSESLILAAEDRKLLILEGDNARSIAVDHGLFAVDVRSDGLVAAGGCCGDIYVIREDKVLHKVTVGNHVYDVSWGKHLYAASWDGSLYAFTETLKLVKRVDLAENVNVVRTCDNYIAVGTFEPSGIFLFDEDLNLLWSRGGYMDVRAIAWRKDCNGLYALSWDGEVSLYDLEGNELLRGKGPRGLESASWHSYALAIAGWGRVELYAEEFKDIDELKQTA